MSPSANKELCTLVRRLGPGVVHTPRTCEISLAQIGAYYPKETRLWLAALKHGAPKRLLDREPADPAGLAGDLARSAGLSDEDARWAVDSWAVALACQPAEDPRLARVKSRRTPKAAWEVGDNRPGGGGGSMQRRVMHLLVVTLAGGLGGGLPGLTLALYFQEEPGSAIERLPQVSQLVKVLGDTNAALVFGLIGLVGGLTGAAFGWLVGGAQSDTYLRTGGTTLGRLLFASLGAFVLCRSGAAFGILVGGTFGVFLGSLFGALIGAYVGYLIGAFMLIFLVLCLCF